MNTFIRNHSALFYLQTFSGSPSCSFSYFAVFDSLFWRFIPSWHVCVEYCFAVPTRNVPTLTAKRRLIFRWRKRLWQRSALAANRLPRGDALRPKKKIGELRLRLWARMSHSDVIVCEELFSVSNDLELSIKCRWAWLHFLAFICTIHHFWEKYHFSGKIGQLSPINAFSIFLVFVIRNEYLALYLLNPWEVACEWLEGKRVFYGITIAFYCCFSHSCHFFWLISLEEWWGWGYVGMGLKLLGIKRKP